MFENVIYFIFISYYIKKKKNLSRAGKMGELAHLVRGLIGVGQKKKSSILNGPLKSRNQLYKF